jgi:hypothetical protein
MHKEVVCLVDRDLSGTHVTRDMFPSLTPIVWSTCHER